MAKLQLRTFKDIIDAVCESMKIQKQDTESRNRIRRNINMVYLDEVIPYSRWVWLRANRSLQAEPYYGSGTAIVTQNSTTVTLTNSPGSSRKGYFFSVFGSSFVYKIAAHTSGSTTLQLETPFSEATSSTVAFRIWTDSVPLPTDCKEVIEVTGDYTNRPLQNYGLQEMRSIYASAPKQEGRPQAYTVSNYVDPSPYVGVTGLPAVLTRSSNGLIKTLNFAADVGSMLSVGDNLQIEGAGNYTYNGPAVVSSITTTQITYTGTVALNEDATGDMGISISTAGVESYEAYRNLIVHPSLSNLRSTLHVDYQINAEPLEDDTDEPLMPIEDRVVLFYGGMAMSCDRERNPEWAAQNEGKFQNKLARMAGKTGDQPEKPVLQVSNIYLRTKRVGGSSRGFWNTNQLSGFNGFSGGSVTPTGTPNSVAIFDENGDLVASTTISLSALEFLIGTQGGLSALIAPSDTTLINSWSATTYKGLQIQYQINRGAAFEHGTFTVSSDGSVTSYGTDGSWGTDTGIDFIADIFAGDIRVRAVADASGPTANLSYKVSLL